MKIKTNFSIGEGVTSPIATGIIKECAAFATHTEYLIEWPDQTATWLHENQLSVVGQASSLSSKPSENLNPSEKSPAQPNSKT